MSLMIWAAVSGGVLLLAGLLLASRFQFEILAKRNGEYDYASVKITGLYGLFLWKAELTSARLQMGRIVVESGSVKGPKGGFRPLKRMRKIRRRKKAVTQDDLVQYARKARLMLKHTRNFLDFLRKSAKHLHCARLHWDVNIGLGDAALTATAAGAISGSLYTLLGIVTRWMTLDSVPTVAVSPDYERRTFDSRLSAMLWMPAWRFIWVWYRFAVTNREMLKNIRNWQTEGQARPEPTA